MGGEQTTAAIKAKRDRARRKAATPLDVVALIEQGRQDRADFASVARIEAHVKGRVALLARQGKVWERARILADLADWLASEREVLARARQIRGGVTISRESIAGLFDAAPAK